MSSRQSSPLGKKASQKTQMWHRGGIGAVELDWDHRGVSLHRGEKRPPDSSLEHSKIKDHEEEKERQRRRRKAASKVKLKSGEYRKSPGIYLKSPS